MYIVSEKTQPLPLKLNDPSLKKAMQLVYYHGYGSLA